MGRNISDNSNNSSSPAAKSVKLSRKLYQGKVAFHPYGRIRRVGGICQQKKNRATMLESQERAIAQNMQNGQNGQNGQNRQNRQNNNGNTIHIKNSNHSNNNAEDLLPTINNNNNNNNLLSNSHIR